MAKTLVLLSWCVMLGILARKQARMESEREVLVRKREE